jgi:hypothetical protein
MRDVDALIKRIDKMLATYDSPERQARERKRQEASLALQALLLASGAQLRRDHYDEDYR